MRVLRYAKWIMLVVILLDVSGRHLLLKNETKFDFLSATNPESHRLIVYVHGVLTDGVNSSRLLVPMWRRRGDVLLVTVAGGRSDLNATADDVTRWIMSNGMDYDEIVFIGASRGGLTVNKITQQLASYKGVVKAVILAAPTGNGYFKYPLNIASLGMWTWWAGPISNATTGKLFLKLFFAKPEEENIEPGVDRQELAQRVKESQSKPISVYADDVRTMNAFEPEPLSMRNIDGVYIMCLRDIITRDEAYAAWALIFGGDLPLVRSDTTHVGFPEMPDAFEQDFIKAFELIGVYED